DIIQEKYSMLDRVAEGKFFDLCDKRGVTFQAYSPLERGTLTGKITKDTKVDLTLAKSKIKWFEAENLPKIAVLGEKWAPLCKKYDCTMTQLVIGWTCAQGNGKNVNALCGARKLHQIEENAKGGDVVVSAADIASMRKDVEAIS
ncbi:MAG: aldo/keto reductase, partial [Treponemataceae bacterium]